MTGGVILTLVVGGLGLAMVLLVICRGHWFALLDTMHRAGPGLLRDLDWPLEHPFNVPDPMQPDARPFPVRTLRARVLLRGLPAPERCPAAAVRHARAFRLWALVFLLALSGAVALLISPATLFILAALGAVQWALTRPWPRGAAT